MDRKGWYLKPATRAIIPGVWFSVCVTPRLEGVRGAPQFTRRLWGHAHAAVSYRKRNGWTHPELVRFGCPDALHRWIRSAALVKRTNWIVCPCASETLTLTNWWNYAERRGIHSATHRASAGEPGNAQSTADAIVVEQMVVKGIPDIITFRDAGQRFRWVSGLQYRPDGITDSELAAAAHSAHHREAASGAQPTVSSGAITCLAWLTALRELSDWWKLNARSCFTSTVGQLAVGMLRSYAPPKVLTHHTHPDAQPLERSAAFGGRASCWFVGHVGYPPGDGWEHCDHEGNVTSRRVDGPAQLWDVRSMYPVLLRDKRYPVKIMSVRENMEPTHVLELARDFGVIARCTIHTRRAEYPARIGERVVYPVGRFVTTLTGPELLTLQADGELLKCHLVATYHLGTPFREWAEKLLALRRSASAAGNSSGESFAKLLANSLAGKLAQRRGGWARCGSLDEKGRWGETETINAQTGASCRVRWIAGLAWRWEDDKTGSGPFTFAFAYLAAYGRVQMRQLRDLCPPRTVVSQDTDGLWTLPAGTATLAQALPADDGEPGRVRRERQAANARWFGPRHYWADGQWTLSGFHQPNPADDGHTVWDQVESPLWGRRATAAPTDSYFELRRSFLKLDLAGGCVQPDGWVTPLNRLPKSVAELDELDSSAGQSVL